MKNIVVNKIIWVVAACLCLSAYAIASIYDFGIKQPKVKKVKKEKIAFEKIDEKLLKDLNALMNSMDITTQDLHLNGTITVYNPQDSTENLDRIAYQTYKEGHNFYYQIGKTEMLNAKDFYCFIDHEASLIVLDSSRAIRTGLPLLTSENLKALLKEQGFKLYSTEDSLKKTIIIENPYHLSLHKYALTYDKLTKRVINAYTKFTYLEDPFNGSKDKIINITFNHQEVKTIPSMVKNLSKASDKVKLLTEYYRGYSINQRLPNL